MSDMLNDVARAIAGAGIPSGCSKTHWERQVTEGGKEWFRNQARAAMAAHKAALEVALSSYPAPPKARCPENARIIPVNDRKILATADRAILVSRGGKHFAELRWRWGARHGHSRVRVVSPRARCVPLRSSMVLAPTPARTAASQALMRTL
jgi:hypothetical protein